MTTPATALPARGDADWYDWATDLHTAVTGSVDKTGDTMTGSLEFSLTSLGVILIAPDAGRWRLVVDNAGNLSTVAA